MKLIVSDLDGTLLHNKKISPKNYFAIKSWQDEGNIFIFATGRSISEVKQYMYLLKNEFPIIVCNGNVIYYPESDHQISMAFLDKNYVKRLLKILKTHNLLKNFVLYGENSNYVINGSELFIEKLKSWGTEYIIIESNDFCMDDKFLKILIYDNEETVAQILSIDIFDSNVDVLQTSSKLLDIFPKGVSKGEALKKILSLKGDQLSEVFVVGDGINDLSLALDNTILVAVENAIPQLKEISQIIVKSNDNDAIYDLIQKINYKKEII